jgi:5'-deoxynucleotidase YfbR-like HD superfamily hydrolase
MLLKPFIPKSTYRAAIDYALTHDDTEILTADIPSTVKRAGYVKVDEDTLTYIVQGPDPHKVDPLVKATVKLADLSEAAIFCMEEIALGNKLIKGVFADVLKNYNRALDGFVSASGADKDEVKERTMPPFKKGTFDFEYYTGNLL